MKSFLLVPWCSRANKTEELMYRGNSKFSCSRSRSKDGLGFENINGLDENLCQHLASAHDRRCCSMLTYDDENSQILIRNRGRIGRKSLTPYPRLFPHRIVTEWGSQLTQREMSAYPELLIRQSDRLSDALHHKHSIFHLCGRFDFGLVLC